MSSLKKKNNKAVVVAALLMATNLSRLVQRAGNISRSFSSKSHLIRSGPGLKEFVKGESVHPTAAAFGEHQLDCKLPYLRDTDVDGKGRKGITLI